MECNDIKALLKERGLTYERLGEEIGVSAQAISEVVNGRTTSSTARYAFAKALGLEVDDIWPKQEQAA